MDHLVVNNTNYRIVKSLGEGAFGVVYHVRADYGWFWNSISIRGDYAMKVVRGSELATIRKEMEVLRDLSHINIVTLCDFGINSIHGTCIVMEMCHGGSLNQALSKPIAETQKKGWCMQLANAIAYLHGKDIVHRDIKPDNILLTNRGTLKVADFGLAREFYALRNPGAKDQHYLMYMSTFAGTKLFMAPEVWDGRYGRSADVYSLGLVFYVIWKQTSINIQSRPYYVAHLEGKPLAEVQRRKKNAKLPDCDTIIQYMTQYDKKKRPKMHQVVELWNRKHGTYCTVV